MKKPKVCFITPFFYPVIGGVETHILETSKELIKKGYEVSVITSNSDRKGSIKLEDETYQGVKVIRCKTWFRIGFGEVFFPRAIKELKRINPDIIHIHGFRHWYNLIPLFTKKPSFITPHWPDYEGQRPLPIEMLRKVMDLSISKILFKINNKICIVTDSEKKWVESFGINESKIVLTPNALPKEYFMPKKNSGFKKKYGVEKKIVVLSVSRIHKSKGIDQLIEVAKITPNAHFVIIGKDGGDEKRLKKIVSKYKINNVVFGGTVSEKDKIAAYRGADIFCQPSHFEAFGISILEAMSQGLPCIVSSKGGMPWVVDKTGLVFEDYNLHDLKSKLDRLISDKKLRDKLGKLSEHRARKFTWKKTADLLDKEYRKYL